MKKLKKRRYTKRAKSAKSANGTLAKSTLALSAVQNGEVHENSEYLKPLREGYGFKLISYDWTLSPAATLITAKRCVRDAKALLRRRAAYRPGNLVAAQRACKSARQHLLTAATFYFST